MTAKRIEVHISRDEAGLVDTHISAFGQLFYFRSIVSSDIKEKDVIAVYLPKEVE